MASPSIRPAGKGSSPDPTEWRVVLRDQASQQMERLMANTGHSMQSLVEISITLLEIVADATQQNRKVLLATKSGRPLEEIAIPRFDPRGLVCIYH